eukprot:Rmarinus@m.13206
MPVESNSVRTWDRAGLRGEVKPPVQLKWSIYRASAPSPMASKSLNDVEGLDGSGGPPPKRSKLEQSQQSLPPDPSMIFDSGVPLDAHPILPEGDVYHPLVTDGLNPSPNRLPTRLPPSRFPRYEKKAWRQVAHSWSPGPIVREVAPKQHPRNFKPLGTAFTMPNLVSKAGLSDEGLASSLTEAVNLRPGMTERIGTNYSPSLEGISVRMLQQIGPDMDMETLRQTVCGLTEEEMKKEEAKRVGVELMVLEQAKRFDTGAQGEKPPMPLEYFDNHDFESRTPQEWLELAEDEKGTPAHSQYRYANGMQRWLGCRVLAYNKDDDVYLVRWDRDGKEKWVTRLNLRFDSEDETYYEKRLTAAIELRKKVEKRTRMNDFVDNISDDRVAGISGKEVEHILGLVAAEIPMAHFEVMAKCVTEAETEYLRCQKLSTAVYELRNPRMLNRLEDLRLPPPPEKPAAPEFACVDICSSFHFMQNYPEIRNTISRLLFLAQGQVTDAIHMVMDNWHLSHSKDHIFTEEHLLTELKLPCTLEDFKDVQELYMDELFDKLEGEWTSVITNTLIDSLEQTFDFYCHSREEMEGKRLVPFLVYVRMLMSQFLRQLAYDSSLAWKDFLFKYQAEPPQVDENGAPVAVEPELQRGGLFHGVSKPLFRVKLTLGEGKYEFVPSLEDVRDGVLALFDLGVERVQKIVQIDSMLVPLIEQPRNPLLTLDPNDPNITEPREAIRVVIEDNLTEPRNIAALFDDYQYLLKESNEEFCDALLGGEDFPTMEVLQAEIEKLRDHANEIERKCYDDMGFGLFAVDTSELKRTLSKLARSRANLVLDRIADRIREQNVSIAERYEDMMKKAQEEPENVEQLTELKEYIQQASGKLIKGIEKEMKEVQNRVAMAESFFRTLSDEDFELYVSTRQWPNRVLAIIEETQFRIEADKRKFMEELRVEKDDFAHQLSNLEDEVLKFKEYGDLDAIDDIADNVTDLQKRLDDAKEKATLINSREELFGWASTAYPELNEISKDFQPYALLWTSAAEFNRSHPEWMFVCPFKDLEPEKITNDVNNWWKTMYKLAKTFREEDGPRLIATTMKQRLDEFKEHLPLITNLCNPGLRDRHWDKLSNDIGFRLKPTPDLTLSRLLEMNLGKYEEVIDEMCAVASKEYSLENALDAMRKEWNDIFFETTAYRDTGTHVLKSVDDIMQLLDDHIVKTQTMRGSPYIKPFEEQIHKWEEQLKLTQEIIDEWISCQRTWMYLEPIFGSEDIMRQMPVEGRKFAGVDTFFRNVMESAVTDPKVETCCQQENLLPNFQRANAELDLIQKGLNEYLETKRLAFPRFFFLSNDELLEILSQTKDPLRVQPHLAKCFENIKSLEFQDNLEITAMFSAEGEKVNFKQTIRPTSLVEEWLLKVEEVMVQSLKEITAQAITEYKIVDRTKWILSWPGQVVLAGSQFYWTLENEEAIRRAGTKGLIEYETKCNQQLEDIINIVRGGELRSMDRITLGALVTIDVHARDTVTSMIQSKVSTVDDFDWISQLRYYLEDDRLVVRMISAQRDYGYEYLGNTFRLVITPLTDRCYRTLMGALQLNLGGAPEGPAGTGKTETTKDLAKAVANYCVVFNCSDGLDYLAMGKFFKGLASCGAWACFDEFNRIDLEVLSVIAQQILSIQRAIAMKMKRFTFEGSDLQVNANCAVFITMNPGYAGRSELPDNLKALFRAVAMMVPNYALISEISLMSFGYKDARNLARKLVTVYKLSSEQLSSQDHYDFGMRAVKSVLNAAGRLIREMPDASEDILVLRAINDVNIPKFLSNDLPLFAGITSDLFPGVTLPEPEFGPLLPAIHKALEKLEMQPAPGFIQKIIELYAMILVRHGLMLVGSTMSGKTQCYRVLAEAFTSIKDDPEFADVHYHVINPKSVTMGQLYGCFDDVSHEWTDGVLATTVRSCAQDESSDRQWVVFDGPVDAIWIENMNTVLDDNKKLCLMSGEIIKLSPEMTMMFEVEDLAVASPATVSRCGMVYVEPEHVGWKSLVQSWIAKLPADTLKNQADMLLELTDWLIPGSLEFVQRNCFEPVPAGEMMHVASFLNMLKSTLGKFITNQEEYDGLGNKDLVRLVESQFVFSVIWSVACTTNDAGRRKFDEWFRKLVAGGEDGSGRKMLVPFPEEGLIYDYLFVDDRCKWVEWMKTTDEYSIPDSAHFHEITVPTIDSVRTSYLLDILIRHHCHTLLVGPTGTGKTIVAKLKLENDLDKETFMSVFVSFSAQTSANATQDIIDAKLDKRRKGIFGPPFGKQCVVFVDDLNMPKKETYGAQPPIELLRQWMDHGGWYDRATTEFRTIVDMCYVAAMGPPGGGRNPITHRYVRHFNMIGVTDYDDDSLGVIYGTILKWFFSDFPHDIQKLQAPMVNATVSIYRTIAKELLPTPAKSHYTFNLRDLSKVFQGVLAADKGRVTAADQMIRLWCHECMRVFHDRLINFQDREWFTTFIKGQVEEHFKKPFSEVSTTDRLVFADFIDPDAENKIYDEVSDLDALKSVIDDYLMDYNLLNSNRRMDLVVFPSAIEHTARICRILRQPFGNGLLVGVGGSGRQSLTRLAAHVNEMECVQIEISKSYGRPEWKEDLQRLLMKAGGENQKTVFLFSDTQIIDESFVEDINNILNTGEVPNLFTPDVYAETVELCRKDAVAAGRGESPQSIFSFFVERCRINMHVVLCFSPIGDAFRTRLRMFPSLVNCCTIDWFTEWPEEALRSVAMYFLKDIPEMTTEILSGVVTTCVKMHESIRVLSKQMFDELHRHYYVTPTSYLELINTFKTLLEQKRTDVRKMQRRYGGGLEKLLSTSTQVKDMQVELEALQPVLVKKSAEVKEMMVVIEKDSKEAAEKKAVVEVEEAAAAKEAEETQRMKDECEADLAEAMPALNDALKALDSLNKNDLNEVKSLKTPPAGVKLVMETLCILFGVPPIKVPGPKLGQKIDDYWEPAKKQLLNDPHLLQRMVDFDKDSIADASVNKLGPYIANPDYDPEKIKKASRAAMGMCQWVRAMVKYHHCAKIVEPKKIALAEAEATLASVRASLAEKKRVLDETEAKIRKLKQDFDNAVTEKESLAEQVVVCEKRLVRAQKLIGGLGGEKDRWTEMAEKLSHEYNNLTGDVLVSAGIIAYLGAFTLKYRDSAVDDWMQLLVESRIPSTDGTSLNKVLGQPVLIRQWTICGLPTDKYSIDNGIILSKSRRWPLCIDPQGQANKWIKNMEKDNHLNIIKPMDTDFTRSLENAVQFGTPVLLENVGEELDPVLEPLLLKQTFKQGGVLVIKLGDATVEYSPSFRFYITTKLRNPHYPPEICVKVALVNFMITMDGLEDQMLGIVVAKERPDLEEEKNDLIVQMARNKKELQDIEDKILELLSNAEGNILDDEVLIETLASAKHTANEVTARVRLAEETERKIDQARLRYVPVAKRSSILFFCIADLCLVDPMYQYSLAWFIMLFNQAIQDAPPSDHLDTRLKNLNNTFTYLLYRNICRSLFEKDKLLFSFLLLIKIMDGDGSLNQPLFRFFITGIVTLETGTLENPAPDWVEPKAWNELQQLEKLDKFNGFCKSFARNLKSWKKYYEHPDPMSCPLPDKWNKELDLMEKMCVLRCLRPGAVVPAIQQFVSEKLGQKFVEPPPFDLAAAYNDSNSTTPLIFVLSPGADPATELLKLADGMGMGKKTWFHFSGPRSGSNCREDDHGGYSKGHMGAFAELPLVRLMDARFGANMREDHS